MGDLIHMITDFLSRLCGGESEDAEYYREIYGQSEEHTTMCKIMSHTGEIFGAFLSVTMTEKTAKRILAKNIPNHEAFTETPKKGFFARLFGK